MQKINKIIILFSITLIFLISLSAVSAEDNSNSNITINDAESIDYTTTNSNIKDIEDNNDKHILCSNSSSKNKYLNTENKNRLKVSKETANVKNSSTSENQIYYVDCDNFTDYFNNGVLKDDFKDSVLVMNGEFTDKGIITIKSSDVKVIGNNSLFNNTVFCLESDNILLSGLNFVLDQKFYDNDYAGILILGGNNTIYNCTMNYTVPDDSNGFCIYTEGPSPDKINGFKLVNNTFNFVANNLNSGWDYAIFIDYVDNAIIYGNTVNTSLPLRSVDWDSEIYGGVTMDAVSAFVAQNCTNMSLSNNKIYSYVTSGCDSYPTLDTVLIYSCNNAIIENNSIYSEDFDSKDGKDNYLQGIDLYLSDNVTIIYNDIHINTTGGRVAAGTAYPIQVTGPADNIKIAYNNLTSISNGPNIGIYSENYYGDTKIDIFSNFINVTGLAGAHSWALVAGIEVQDTNDIIWNNTIIVNNLGEYDEKNNIYGISFSQNTLNDHTYNIQYNNVITNGRYAVYLSGSGSEVINSIVSNNVLNTYNDYGDDAVYIGYGYNNTINNNTNSIFENNLNIDDLPNWLKNYKSVIPTIFIPKYINENSNGTGLTENKGNGTAAFNTNNTTTWKNNGTAAFNTNTTTTLKTNDTTAFNTNTTTTLKTNENNFSRNANKYNNSIPNNKTKYNNNEMTDTMQYSNPGTSGIFSPVSAVNPTDSGSSAANPNVYEVNKKDNIAKKVNNYPQLAIICIITILCLLFIGYKRKNKEE